MARYTAFTWFSSEPFLSWLRDDTRQYSTMLAVWHRSSTSRNCRMVPTSPCLDEPGRGRMGFDCKLLSHEDKRRRRRVSPAASAFLLVELDDSGFGSFPPAHPRRWRAWGPELLECV